MPGPSAPAPDQTQPLRRLAVKLLYEHTVLVLTLILLVSGAGVMWHLERLQSELVEAMAQAGTQLQAETLEELRSFYTSDVVERVRHHGIDVSHDYLQKDKAIPLPATLTIELGRRIGEHGSGLKVRLYSDYPFPWRKDGGPRDAFEHEALQFLRQQPDAVYSRVQQLEGVEVLRYATADRMREQCIDCHRSHPASPKTDWKVGDVRGVLEIIRPLGPVVAEARSKLRDTFVLAGVLALLGLLALSLVITKLRRSSAELGLRVNELSRVNSELEHFAYVASHDLQEPLRMITSYLQLLDQRYRSQLGADAHEFINYAVDGAKRMQVLINDVLAYSRLTTRAESFAPTDCQAVFAAAVANLRYAITQTGASVSADALPTVMGDATQLTQLIQNLIGNALKFRGEDPPRIHVSVAAELDFWRISVSDNGIGIELGQHERIFQLFQRLHQREQYPGTGIGLAICKKIVERHGGQIWVESTPGHGSTFHFTLPRDPPTRPSRIA